VIGEVVVDGAGRIAPGNPLALEKDVVSPVTGRRVALGDGIPAKIHIFCANPAGVLSDPVAFRII
jgi:hypothetical protein